jgi:predicted DCC family thiol-disulfide oxidoreductase YuxK
MWLAIFVCCLSLIIVDVVFLRPPTRSAAPGTAIILFDGVCLLCSRFVHFVIDHDAADRFRFLPLQSESAGALLAKHGIPNDLNTVVLLDEDGAHVRSTAALRVLRCLGSPYRLLFIFIGLPGPIRDAAYRLVASTRYTIFGKDENVCRRLTPATRRRMLPTDSATPSTL